MNSVCLQTPPYTIRSREIKLGTHVYLRAPKQPSSTLALHRAVRFCTTAHPPSPLTQLLSLLMTSHWWESYQGEMSLPTRTGHLVLVTIWQSEDKRNHHRLKEDQSPSPADHQWRLCRKGPMILNNLHFWQPCLVTLQLQWRRLWSALTSWGCWRRIVQKRNCWWSSIIYPRKHPGVLIYLQQIKMIRA